uniref:C2H2-type domain-containing protein n=1 Tax=Denticeps clupeoides TaxID=299321 RepID=A0AAY4AM03_9TELE
MWRRRGKHQPAHIFHHFHLFSLFYDFREKSMLMSVGMLWICWFVPTRICVVLLSRPQMVSNEKMWTCHALTGNSDSVQEEVEKLTQIYFGAEGPVLEPQTAEPGLSDVEVVVGPPADINQGVQSGELAQITTPNPYSQTGDSSSTHEHEASTPTRHHCSVCGTNFRLQWDLRKHKCVTSDQSLVCAQCKRTFASRKQLVKHEFVHKKSHSCPDCGKFFRDKSLGRAAVPLARLRGHLRPGAVAPGPQEHPHR